MNGESSIDIYTLCMHAKLLQWCLTLCDAMDCSPPGSSDHGILQARILEWVVMSSSRGSSRLRDPTRVSYASCTGSGFFTTNTTYIGWCKITAVSDPEFSGGLSPAHLPSGSLPAHPHLSLCPPDFYQGSLKCKSEPALPPGEIP